MARSGELTGAPHRPALLRPLKLALDEEERDDALALMSPMVQPGLAARGQFGERPAAVWAHLLLADRALA